MSFAAAIRFQFVGMTNELSQGVVKDTAMLLFKKKFMAAIRAGEKTQTVRLWPYRRMRPGQRSYIPGAGYIVIEAVDQVTLESLTDQDAVLDGFPTADELRAEIGHLYQDKATAGHHVYRIRFRVLGDADQEACRREKEHRKRTAAGGN